MSEQIYGLIGQAMKKIRAIGKDSTATNQSGKQMYKFRGIDAVYNALNPVMGELGLFICPEVLEQTREERKTMNGGTLIYSILKVKFTMYAPDGSNVSCVVIGEGMDSGDKASNKAMSIALKYMMFQLFMIPTEEMIDPDAEVHEVQPKPMETPTTIFIRKMIRDTQERLGLASYEEARAKVFEMVNALVKSGTIKPVDWNKITLAEAEVVFEAIEYNFKGDKK